MAEFLKYLFNSKGIWIATQVGTNVFSVGKKWLGWVRDEDQIVINSNHKYYGTVMCNNRLFYCEAHPPVDRPILTIKIPPIQIIPDILAKKCHKNRLPEPGM